MDGPRQAGLHVVYTIEGRCAVDGTPLGAGKYIWDFWKTLK